MANDLRANQVRLNKIISSGSIPILIYPSSSAANFQGGLTNFSTTAVGTDVFLYVSGAVGARGGGSPKISVFGGDLHVSGNFTVDGTSPGGGGTNFFTEIAFEQIETTGSVAMTYLSSSTGVEITGSLTNGSSGLVASGLYAHAEGASTTASGYGSHSEGFNTLASNFYSHAEGTATIASSFYSHAEGNTTVASAMSSHAEGEFTTASGQAAHAEGSGTTAGPNSYAHAEGLYTLASGYGSHTEGHFTTASINYAHAEGSGSVASGIASHAEGYMTNASGIGSHAEGNGTTASGLVSHAEGFITDASGIASHAEGNGTTASGIISHAEGYLTNASNFASHAEGSGSVASGIASHAQGIYTLAFGTGSFSAGIGTWAFGTIDGNPPTITQAVFGKYNVPNNTDSLFVVGDGLNTSNRRDILRVNSGSVQVTGSFVAPNITGSLSGTVAGNPFIVAGSNITTNYNSLGQWEITGSGGGGGGTNFFTELALNSIETTGSVAMTYLSSSTGAQITGSFILSSSIPAVILTSVRQGEPSVTAPGLYAYSQGTSTAAQGNYSHAEGNGCVASGQASHAEGFATLASNSFTHSEGYQTAATGPQSHAEGQATTASGDQSHAEGYITTASNFAAHSEGQNTLASGDISHAEGYLTTAGASAAHSEGSTTIASGQASHSEGYLTKARGFYSHAQGVGSEAYGAGTLAAGLYTVASGSGINDNPPTTTQAAFGKYNLQGNNDSLFVIGDGLNASNRHDVLRVNSGSVQITGSFEITGAIKFDTINVSPLYATMTTSDATGTVLSGSLLTSQLVNASVGKLDFNVLAVAQATDDYASFTFSTTIRRTQAGSTLVIASTELDSAYDGANAATWDININSNGDIVCTGSAGTVHWYAQVTKKMVLSGSSVIVY